MPSQRFEVRQKLGIGKKYNVYREGASEPFLTAKKKKLRLKEDFRLTDPETGDERYRVKADRVLDVGAVYEITDTQTGATVGSVRRKRKSFAKHEYALADADGTEVALIKEDSVAMAIVRRFVTTLVPFSYVITSADGSRSLGSVSGAFSIRDRYEIEVDDEIDPMLAVVGTVVIDAIEEN
jgi:uncharacterized protein YxjI